MSICYVTSFLDLNRENWKKFKRTFQEYLDCFKNYIELFKHDDSTFFVFIDEKYIDILSNSVKDVNNIILKSINTEWMYQNIKSWKTLETEREIMNSDSYKERIKHRSDCPETYIPEYTLINHSKIDFINYVIDNNLSTCEYYCWTDFGYFAKPDIVPSKLIDINKIEKDKINYALLKIPVKQDLDPIYTLIYAPEVISGGFFIGSRQKMKEYQELYHKTLSYYQNELRIADDDQALILYCFGSKQDLFAFHVLNRWSVAFLYFSK